jgi:hypothetical protein
VAADKVDGAAVADVVGDSVVGGCIAVVNTFAAGEDSRNASAVMRVHSGQEVAQILAGAWFPAPA